MSSTARRSGPTAIEVLAIIAAGLSLLLLIVEKKGLGGQIHFFWWHGFIWSLFFGLASGSYATSFAARLPRGIPTLGGRHPYCGSCNTLLTRRDLFTVFSYLATGGKCRYCQSPIPFTVFATELATVLVFVLAWLRYETFDDRFLLVTCFGMCAVILGVVYATDKIWLHSMALSTVIIALLYRTWLERSVSSSVLFAATGFVIAALVWRMKNPGTLLDSSDPGSPNLWHAWLSAPFSALAVLSCLWLPQPGVLAFLLLYAATMLFPERLRPGIGLAVLFMLILFAPVFDLTSLRQLMR